MNISLTNQKSKGFTMVELILYIGLLSMMLMMLTSIFSTSLDLQLESRSTSTLDQDARFLLTRLSYDVSRASSITTPASIGDQGETLTLLIGTDAYTYTLSNGNLILTEPSGSYQMNNFNTSFSSLSFQRLGNSGGKNSIQMNATLESRTQLAKGIETKSIRTTFGTR